MNDLSAAGVRGSDMPAGANAGGRLTVARRLGYGVGDLGINFYFGLATAYLLYFYTDVFGLSAAVAGSVFLVARVIDAAVDPLMGAIADRTRTRAGRFRPWLLWGAPPLALLTVALFSSPDLDAEGKALWAYATYIAFGIAYTAVALPYAALTPTLTQHHEERTTLSTVRMGCAFAGFYVISVATDPLVRLFDSPAQGWQAVAAGYATIATLLLVVCYLSTREAAVPSSAVQVPLRESLRAVRANGPLVIVILVFMGGLMSFNVRTATAIYYCKYVLGRPDLIATYFAWTMPVMMATLVAVPWLARRVGKAGAVITGALVTIAGGVGLYLTPVQAVEQALFFCCVMAVGGAPVAVMGWSMTADTVDYAELRTGVRADAQTYSIAAFFQQLAAAFAGAGVAALLAFFGYVANEVQTPASLQAILVMMSLVPCAIMAVVIGACLFYPLNARRHAEVTAALHARRAAHTG